MSGISVPQDRTIAQPVVAYCRNPQCQPESGKRFTFFVEHDKFGCPKCGADKAPMVGINTLTHLLIKHPQGPVKGYGGIRYVVGCDDARAYLATATNDEAATGDVRVANCPGCLAKAKTIDTLKPLLSERRFIVPGSPEPKPEPPKVAKKELARS